MQNEERRMLRGQSCFPVNFHDSGICSFEARRLTPPIAHYELSIVNSHGLSTEWRKKLKMPKTTKSVQRGRHFVTGFPMLNPLTINMCDGVTPPGPGTLARARFWFIIIILILFVLLRSRLGAAARKTSLRTIAMLSPHSL
jgi:hypothetical protein